MARKLRVEYPGAIYHVTLRGNWRQNIFKDDSDRERFLWRLEESANTYNVRVYQFCLMTNHAHLVVETPEGNISRFMQSFTTGYTVYYNLRNRKSGHLFHGRFGAKLVQGDSYLLALSRYVHLNPVFIGKVKNLPVKERVKKLRAYKWSSYRSYTGRAKELDCVEYGPTWGLAGGRSVQAAKKRYREFVDAGIAESDDDFIKVLKESRHAIGDDDFTDMVGKLYQKLIEKRDILEDVSFRKEVEPLSAADIIDVVCKAMGIVEEEVYRRRRNSMVRPVMARMLCKYAGMTQRDVAKLVNLAGGSAVSLQMRKLNEQLSGDKTLRKLVNTVSAQLESLRQGKARSDECGMANY